MAESEATAGEPLLLQVLAGRATTRRPVWLMRQAGRCLPEYRALRDKYSFTELMGHAELAARVTLQPLDRFAFDGAITFADIMSPLPALGIDVEFAPGPVIAEPLREASQIRALPDPDGIPAEELAPDVYETQRLVARELPAEATLIGFAGAPLTLASYLVEGKGATGFPRLRALARSEPAAFGELLDKLSRLTVRYLVEQVRAGAQAVQIFDSWAGLFSRSEWQEKVAPHLAGLLQRFHSETDGVPAILFLHQAPHLVDDYAELATTALSVDWRVDLLELRTRYPGLVLQGNLDPAILLAGAETTAVETRRLLARVPARGHVVNLGHGVLPETPLDSIQALVDTVHQSSAPE